MEGLCLVLKRVMQTLPILLCHQLCQKQLLAEIRLVLHPFLPQIQDGKVEASGDALSMNYYYSMSYSFSYSNVPSYDYFSYSHSFSHDFSFSYDFSNDFPSDDYVPVVLNTRRRVRRTNINAFGRQVLRRKRRDDQ